MNNTPLYATLIREVKGARTVWPAGTRVRVTETTEKKIWGVSIFELERLDSLSTYTMKGVRSDHFKLD